MGTYLVAAALSVVASFHKCSQHLHPSVIREEGYAREHEQDIGRVRGGCFPRRPAGT